MPDPATPLSPDAPAMMARAAAFRPASYREADNSMEVVWSIGAAGLRFDWYDGEYYTESLSMEPGAVRLDRLNAGACLVDSHQTRSLAAVLGSVVPGSARIENGQGIARVRLATTPDVADTNQKIIDGHIRSCSVGYAVFQYLRTEESGSVTMHATDWEPQEISMVIVPFDAAAQVRMRSENMPEIIDADHREDRGGGNRQTRGTRPVTLARIRDLCGRSDDISRAFERDLIAEHEDDPLTERVLQQRIADELVSRRESPPIDVRGDRRGETNAPMLVAMENALYARLSGTAPTDDAREFMGASMADMTRGILEARGERVRWTPAAKLMQRWGGHGITDFPNLLQAATGRYLLDLYQAVEAPMKAIARKRLVPDFRMINALSMLPMGALRLVNEAAEFKRVTINEGTNGYKLATFGEIFSLTRQAFINDDLGYFSDMARMWARAAAETEATQLAGMVTANGPTLSDGNALYHASHGNLAATGSAITVASLTEARQAMRSQLNNDGTPANVVPKYLVVGAALETSAEQAIANLSAVSQPGQVNPFSGKLELVVDPRLTGNSWRLFADPANWPVLEYAQLIGQEGLFTDTRIGFEIDGFDFKARIDFGAGAIDYRGTFKNPGN